MSLPVVVSIPTFRQGMGESWLPKDSVLEIDTFFTTPSGESANLRADISIDNGVTWYPSTLHSAANGLNVAPPASGHTAMVLVDVNQTWINDSLVRGNYPQTKVRLFAKSTTTLVESSGFISNAIACKSTLPSITSLIMSQWTGYAASTAAQITMVATDQEPTGLVVLPDVSGDGHHYRASLLSSDLAANSTPLAYHPYTNTPAFNFGNTPEGPQTIYVKIYDQFYNTSALASVGTYLQLNAPSRCFVRLTGTQGNHDYTGIQINNDGSFTPNRYCTVNVGATSTNPNIPINFQILNTSNVETAGNVGTNISLIPANAQQIVKLTTNPSAPTLDDFNTDATTVVSVQFTDAANNFTVVNATIRLNTRIYLSAHHPLRHRSSSYLPKVTYVSSGGAEVFVPQSLIQALNPVRAWNEIFYPTTHGYPVDVNGNPDLVFIKADSNLSQMLPTAAYDPILIQTTGSPPVTSIVPDTDGRPITCQWAKDGTKNYNNLESNDIGSLRYWVIDNTGYGDFALEFEWFDLDNTIYGPPFNAQAPYKGDVLGVYDATAPGCLTLTTAPDGSQVWTLANSTLLKEIMSFTGTGSNVINLTNGASVGANVNGAFLSDTITNTPKIVLMLFSDANGTSSGFKLKSGPRHDQGFVNYDVDEANGQLWIHMHETIADSHVRGAADLTTKRFYYDYINNGYTIDFNTGTVQFLSNPSGVVTTDYSWYMYDKPLSNVFVASKSDFVDYYDPPVYIVPSGMTVAPSGVKQSLFEITGSGRMVQHHTWDKDRGLLTIDPSGYFSLPTPTGYVPVAQRITADYYHHTFTRLTSDQWGDLIFRDQILVAAATPNFPDYTWADVKIVNEGNADVQDMQVKFVPRGYDTDGDGNITLTGNSIVDQVLDINRPWDIQQGTKDETYSKMAMAINTSYIWPRFCPRLGGDGIQGSSGAGSIFSTWNNKVYGTVSARQIVFGRAVWILGGSTGNSYPAAITSGTKSCSFEVTGKYYASLLI